MLDFLPIQRVNLVHCPWLAWNMNARFYLENILLVHSLSCCSLTFNVYGIPQQIAHSKFYQAIKAVW